MRGKLCLPFLLIFQLFDFRNSVFYQIGLQNEKKFEMHEKQDNTTIRSRMNKYVAWKNNLKTHRHYKLIYLFCVRNAVITRRILPFNYV